MRLNTILKFVSIQIILLYTISGYSQGMRPGHWEIAEIRSDPSSVTKKTTPSLTLLQRRTLINPGVRIDNKFVSASVPILHHEKSNSAKFALGFYVDRNELESSIPLKNQSIAVRGGYHVDLTASHSVVFGMQVKHSTISNNELGLTTASQWDAVRFHFDPNLPIQEPQLSARDRWLSVDAGVRWIHSDCTRAIRAFAGLVAANINRPVRGLIIQESRTRPTILGNFGGEILQHRNYRLIFHGMVSFDNLEPHRISITNDFSFSNSNPFDLIENGKFSVEVNGYSNYQTGAGLILSQPRFVLGLCYTFPFVRAASYPFNAFELVLGISLFKKQQKKSIEIPTPTRRLSIEPIDAVVIRSDTVKKKIETLSKVKSIKYELDKQFAFESGRAVLDTDARQFLAEIITLMSGNANYRLEIVGHTDNVGSPTLNLRLSKARAQAVADYLLENGVSKERILVSGLGDTQPISINTTEADRAKNRRVHFVIYINE